jgi:anti-sigma B factor antagonist
MSFAVERTSVPGGMCVAVAGEVDMDTAPRMRAAIEAALVAGDPVTVDLGSVTFMDSSGLAALIAARATAAAAGVSVSIERVPRRVADLFTITGLEGMLTPPRGSDLAEG